jgi:uncharacterized protein (TIGR02246 family)
LPDKIVSVLTRAALIAGIAFTLAPAASARNAQRPCVAVAAPQIEAEFAAFNSAWATRDPDKVTALFAPDAVLLATVSNIPHTTPAGIRDYFVSFLKAAPVGTIDTSTLRLGCNTAWRVGTWTVRLTDAATGASTDVKARYSFIYTWQRGQWLIAHLHSSKMPETAAK